MSGTVPTNYQHCGVRVGARDGGGGLCQVPYLIIINTVVRAGARDGRGGLCQVQVPYRHLLIINTVVRELELEMVAEDYVRYRVVRELELEMVKEDYFRYCTGTKIHKKLKFKNINNDIGFF